MIKAISPTLITEARFGTYRYKVRVQPGDVGTTPASDAGIPGLNLGTDATSGMPAFYVDGNASFKFGYALGIDGLASVSLSVMHRAERHANAGDADDRPTGSIAAGDESSDNTEHVADHAEGQSAAKDQQADARQ